MSKAKDPTLEDDSEQDWEKIFSPGGSKIATTPGNPAASAKAAAAAIGVELRHSGSSSAAGGSKDGGSDGAGTEADKIEPVTPGPPSHLRQLQPQPNQAEEGC